MQISYFEWNVICSAEHEQEFVEKFDKLGNYYTNASVCPKTIDLNNPGRQNCVTIIAFLM